MATLRMDQASQDPRTGIWLLRKRVPRRYLGVAGVKSGFVKITTGTADRGEAKRRWPDVLRRWDEKVAAWEEKLSEVALTPERAAVIVAGWAAWVAAGNPLDMGGESSDVFEPMTLPETRIAGNVARMWDRVEAHATEALRVAEVVITAETRPVLLQAMLGPVSAAYLQADLGALGVSGPALNPLQAVRDRLPTVPDAAPVVPAMTIQSLVDAWKTVAAVKPRTIAETEYAMAMLAAFIGHTDASKVGKDDLRRWRDASKAAPDGAVTNTTWNNRLSLIRQVFASAVGAGHLQVNPADNALRLPKSRAAVRLPYSDDDACRILVAARKEAAAGRRWAHWVTRKADWRLDPFHQAKPVALFDGGVAAVAWRGVDPSGVDEHERAGLVATLADLNALNARSVILGAGHTVTLWRLFHVNLSLGGRHYGPTYLNASVDERLSITINGEAVAEVDLKAAQLSIAAGLAGMAGADGLPFPDPYAFPGLHRNAVKAWATRTLGRGGAAFWRHHECAWDVADAAEVQSTEFHAVRAAMVERFPFLSDLRTLVPPGVLDDLPGKLHGKAAGLYLMMKEATIITRAMAHCVALGVPVLPVHDAVLVPASKVHVVVEGIEAAGQEVAGMVPRWELGTDRRNPSLRP